MSIFYEPVNVNQWNLFEKVSGIGHVETFYATKEMKIGDSVLLHVGSQNKDYQSGIYAFGTVINGPYILRNHPEDYCNNRNTVDVRIDYICRGEPLFSHKEASGFIHQFRTVHRIEDRYYTFIQKRCNECTSSIVNQQGIVKAADPSTEEYLEKPYGFEPDEGEPATEPDKLTKKPKKQETLNEYAKHWIEHANEWFSKDFEGFFATFDDFRETMNNSFHGNYVSDMELAKAWDNAVREIREDRTNRNTQDIPLAGGKPITHVTKPPKPSLLRTSIVNTPESNSPVITATEPISGVDNSNGNKIGIKVRHKHYGEGVIVRYNNITMTVRFAEGSEKTFLTQYALENHIIELI